METAGKTSYTSHADAAHALAQRDPMMARLIRDAGPIDIPVSQDSYFAALVQAITYQQLAEPAARTIHHRLVELLANHVTAEAVIRHTASDLHSVGLSANKAASVLDLANKVLDGTVDLDPDLLGRLGDQEIIDSLTTVRGIGPWTAEIFLMINMRRLDVLPAADLGIRKGYALAWNAALPTPKEFEALAEAFHPYRSVLAWYCWRADEIYGKAPISAITAQPQSLVAKVEQPRKEINA